VSWADYSYVMPAGAFGYATQTLLAVAVLHETVSSLRWFGVALICVGVMLVGQTNPNTTKSPSSPVVEPVPNPLVGPLTP
jgi:drug/metabolite transporter (DMT)-like permease